MPYEDVQLKLDSLEDICFSYIKKYWKQMYIKYILNENDIFLPQILSEKLLYLLNDEEIGITDESLQIFLPEKTSLRYIKVHGNHIKEKSSLLNLLHHKITWIEIEYFKSFAIKECLSGFYSEYLTHLNISGCIINSKYVKNGEESSINFLRNFKNLSSLDVSFTNFDDKNLQYLVINLSYIKRLNLSKTFITNLQPLVKMKDLKAINCSFNQYFTTLSTLDHLKSIQTLVYIDISRDAFNVNKPTEYLNDLLKETIWPNLTYLNLSGCWTCKEPILR